MNSTTLAHAKKEINELIQRHGADCPCSYYILTDTEHTYDGTAFLANQKEPIRDD